MISDLGIPCFVVSIAINWDHEDCLVKLFQTALIDKIISQSSQKDAAPLSLPMDPNMRLQYLDLNTLPQEERCTLENMPYCQLIGCLLYLAISTCPDIAFVVCNFHNT